MSADKKREREKKTVALMIRLYCRKNHGAKNALCPDCKALSEYAAQRSDKCPFNVGHSAPDVHPRRQRVGVFLRKNGRTNMESKTFCSNCKVHCYKPEMREKIREVMRFSGPRMVLYHPIMAIRHVIETKKEKRRLENER